MKIVVTGFQPFGGETMNPALEAVKRLPDQLTVDSDGKKLQADLIKVEVPVVFYEGPALVLDTVRRQRPDIVLCVGQAGCRKGITPEFVGINYMDARIADNKGNTPQDQPIREDGDKAYFATLPVKQMAAALKEDGIEGSVSYSAGTFVCNDLLYELLYTLDKEQIPAIGGFVHVPFADQQTEGKEGVPSMPIDTMVRGLMDMLKVCMIRRADRTESVKE